MRRKRKKKIEVKWKSIRRGKFIYSHGNIESKQKVLRCVFHSYTFVSWCPTLGISIVIAGASLHEPLPTSLLLLLATLNDLNGIHFVCECRIESITIYILFFSVSVTIQFPNKRKINASTWRTPKTVQRSKEGEHLHWLIYLLFVNWRYSF